MAGPVNRVNLTLAGVVCPALLDTGSQGSTITSDFVESHPSLRGQKPRATELSIRGAGGQTVDHAGTIVVDIEVMGRHIGEVPVFVVPQTEFRRGTPVLIGTNVLRACRDEMKASLGKRFMGSHLLSSPWIQAFQVINEDGADLA